MDDRNQPLTDAFQPARRDYFQTAHLERDMPARSVRGGAVTVGAQLLKVLVQVVAAAILARLLAPHAFGLIAMVVIILAVMESFKDLGLSMATIQRHEVTHDQVSTLFWINIAVGVGIALLSVPAGFLIAWFNGEPELRRLTWGLAAGFVFGGLSAQHMALLSRQMRFKAVAGIQLGADIFGLSVAVAAAWAGAGVWSLVLQRLGWSAFMAAGAWSLCGWRPGSPRHMRDVRALLAFGGNITGANLINTVTRNIDQVLIGWYWGATPLGLYERAYRTLLVPINNLNAPLFTVAMPTLSRLANRPEQYRAAYLGTVEKLVMVTMPLAALLITAPDLVVRLLFGPTWADAAPILRFLGIAALYQPLSYTVSWLFMTQGRAREMLKWSVVGSSLMALTVAAGLPFGAEGVAAAFAVGGLLLRMPLLFWMVGRRGPVRAADLLRAMMPAATATAATIGAVLLLRWSPAVEALPPVEAFALLVAATVVVALACFALLPQSRGAMRDIARLTGTLRQRGSGA